MFNDEEEDENAVGAVRYPCMPSLVALQQMRNRLHLAYLGRKLMKWTALATGRELRRLGVELAGAYKTFAEDLRNAFMLLARGRYFYPNLNKMVLENVPPKPSVVVTSNTKTISGVKVIQYDIVESGVEPYEHLGIEKGGQKIHEAKVAWLELLKRMVMMLELRTSFLLVETAHKNATKKRNVLAKTVVPRILASVGYILTELEEMEREETFRLKRVKEKKMKKGMKKDTKKVEAICCYCLAGFEPGEGVESKPLCPHCAACIDSSDSSHTTLMSDVPHEMTEASEKEEKKRLETLMTHIDEVMNDLANQPEGSVTPSTEEFIDTCNKFKDSIEHYANIPLPMSICDLCNKNEESETKVKKGPSLTASVKSVKLPKEKYVEEVGELGYFETKTEEIVKVIKFRNDDGTISEEKQVISIKTERKGPARSAFAPKTKSEHDKICCNPVNSPTKSKSEGSLASEVSCPACGNIKQKTSCPLCGKSVSSETVIVSDQIDTFKNKGTCCVDKVSIERVDDAQKQDALDSVCREPCNSMTGQSKRLSPLASCPSCGAKMKSKQPYEPQSKTKIKIITRPKPPVVAYPQHESSRSSRASKSSDCISCGYGSKRSESSSRNVCKKSDRASVSESSVCDKSSAANEMSSICPVCGKDKQSPMSKCPICIPIASVNPGFNESKKEPPKCPKCTEPAKETVTKSTSCEKPKEKECDSKKSKQCPECGKSTELKGKASAKNSHVSLPPPKTPCPKCGKVKQEDMKATGPACFKSKSMCPKCGKDTEKETKHIKAGCPNCAKAKSLCVLSPTVSSKSICPKCGQDKEIELYETCPMCGTNTKNYMSSKPFYPTRPQPKDSCPECGKRKRNEQKSSCITTSSCPSCGALKQLKSSHNVSDFSSTVESCPYCAKNSDESVSGNIKEKGRRTKKEKEIKHSCKHCGQDKGKQKSDKVNCPMCVRVESLKSLSETAFKCISCTTCDKKSSQSVSFSDSDEEENCPSCGEKLKHADEKYGKSYKKCKIKEAKHACKYCGDTKVKRGKDKESCPICKAAELKKSLNCSHCDGKLGPQNILSDSSCSLCDEPGGNKSGHKTCDKSKTDDVKCRDCLEKEKAKTQNCPESGAKTSNAICKSCEDEADQSNKAFNLCQSCGVSLKSKSASDESPCPACNQKSGKKSKSKCIVCQENAKIYASSQPSCPSCGATGTISTTNLDSTCPSCAKGAKSKSQCKKCAANAEEDKNDKKHNCLCAEAKPTCSSCGLPKLPPSDDPCRCQEKSKQSKEGNLAISKYDMCKMCAKSKDKNNFECKCSVKPPVDNSSCTQCQLQEHRKNEPKWSSSSLKLTKPALRNSSSQICAKKEKVSTTNSNGCPVCNRKRSQKQSCKICEESIRVMLGRSKERSCFPDPTVYFSDTDSSFDYSSSNRSLGIETEACCNSLTFSSDDDSSGNQVCCSTQTNKWSSTKLCCPGKDPIERPSCVGEAKHPSKCKVCFLETKDACVSTKTADRYDVRPIRMLAGATGPYLCTCKDKPTKICECRSAPICTVKHQTPPRSKSFNEKDLSCYRNFYI